MKKVKILLNNLFLHYWAFVSGGILISLSRLSQQQISQLKAQVEDLQRTLQEQGSKAEDVSFSENGFRTS